MKLLFLIYGISLFSLSVHAEYFSKYTSILIENCAKISDSSDHEFPEIDYLNMVCPSYGGYEVEISGGDLRYNLKLRYQGVKLPTESFGSFHSMGANQIEWRFKKVKKKPNWNSTIELKALIYRLSFSDYSEAGPPKSRDALVVIKLDGKKSCVTASLKSGQPNINLNIEARKIADNPKSPCLDYEVSEL